MVTPPTLNSTPFLTSFRSPEPQQVPSGCTSGVVTALRISGELLFVTQMHRCTISTWMSVRQVRQNDDHSLLFGESSGAGATRQGSNIIRWRLATVRNLVDETPRVGTNRAGYAWLAGTRHRPTRQDPAHR
jgi:hypothetical protein